MGHIAALTFLSYYSPGFKGGGPIRSLANMVDQMDDVNFRIITLDRDLGDTEPYPGIHPLKWTDVGNAKVMYLPQRALTLSQMRKIMRESDHDVLYFNSFFSPAFTIGPMLLRYLGLAPMKPAIVAPRGEFSRGALAINRLKKRLFIAAARVSGLYRNVIWQASSEYEAQDIYSCMGPNVRVRVAPNLRARPTRLLERTKKVAGQLRVIFLSRITRKKNLLGALSALKSVTNGEVHVSIFGPIEDKAYWQECQAAIDLLPPNVKAVYCGPVEPHQVRERMTEHDVLLFPTYGENFGHVIIEALGAGTPVLLSDQTPWRSLEGQGAGWDLSLSRMDLFTEVLRGLVQMDHVEHSALSAAAFALGERASQDTVVQEQNRSLFQVAANGSRNEG